MTKSELIQTWFERLWHQGDESTIDDMLAPNSRLHGLGEDLVGPDAFRAFYRQFRSAFPEVRVTLTDSIETEDQAFAQASVEVMAANGDGPYTFHGSVRVRVQDGRFVEGWNNFDFLSLVAGMGLVPQDVMTTALTSASLRK